METLTQAIHKNQKPNETMTQCLHRTRSKGETMTHQARDLALADAKPPVPQPVPPSGLAKPTSSAVTATAAKIAWTKPTGGDPVTSYEVSVKTGGTDITGSPFTMSKNTLTKSLSGLTASTAYDVVVKAINGAGATSSPKLTVTTTA